MKPGDKATIWLVWIVLGGVLLLIVIGLLTGGI